jgi:hypothetical protein
MLKLLGFGVLAAGFAIASVAAEEKAADKGSGGLQKGHPDIF